MATAMPLPNMAITLVVALLIVIIVVFGEILEWMDKLEKYPGLKKFAEAKVLRVSLLVVAILALGAVMNDLNGIRDSLKTPPPSPKAPRPLTANELAPCPAPPSPAKKMSQHGNSSTNSVQQGPGSAFSQNQSGGITAGTVNNYGAVDRHLSPETMSALDKVAQTIPNKKNNPVGFITVEGAEAESFADEIAAVFYKHGIGVGTAILGEYWSPETPKGVIVCVKSKDSAAYPLAEKIATAMSSTGVPAVGIMPKPNMDADRVLIVIGSKTDGRPVGAVTSTLVAR